MLYIGDFSLWNKIMVRYPVHLRLLLIYNEFDCVCFKNDQINMVYEFMSLEFITVESTNFNSNANPFTWQL